MPFFNIDYDTLVWQAIPVRLRQPVNYAWLRALTTPVKWLYSVFTGNRADNLYALAHNGQVCFLEAVLNDSFDPILRGIYITDPAYYDPLFLYLDVEDKTVFIDLASEIGSGIIAPPDPVPLYTESETYLFAGLTFIVNIPASVLFDMDRLKAVVDKYRLPGRTYSVVIV